ncbi:MAG: hypothetical protein IKY30_04070 [Oscillospiraceae bacterium]|nr:hypothetical protein [Oscillospiraceae bacterium]
MAKNRGKSFQQGVENYVENYTNGKTTYQNSAKAVFFVLFGFVLLFLFNICVEFGVENCVESVEKV